MLDLNYSGSLWQVMSHWVVLPEMKKQCTVQGKYLNNRTKRWSREIEKFYSIYVQKLTQWKWYRNVGMILRTHTEENLFLPVSLYNNFNINVSCQEDGWGCNTLRPKTNIYDMKKLMNFFLKSAQNISLWIRTFMKRTVWNFIN